MPLNSVAFHHSHTCEHYLGLRIYSFTENWYISNKSIIHPGRHLHISNRLFTDVYIKKPWLVKSNAVIYIQPKRQYSTLVVTKWQFQTARENYVCTYTDVVLFMYMCKLQSIYIQQNSLKIIEIITFSKEQKQGVYSICVNVQGATQHFYSASHWWEGEF